MSGNARPPLFDVSLPDVHHVHRGKVRDLFEIDDCLLLVASDRLSAFDVVLPDPLPDKGEILNRISEFWFQHFSSSIRHHLITTDVASMPAPLPQHPELQGRSSLCRKVKPLMAEFVVRGYITGSAWKDYRRTGSVCGIPLKEGMQEAEPFDAPLFTPSTKAPVGEHDENIDFDQLCTIVGGEKAEQARDLVMRLYREAHAYAAERGIILADTKIELGEDDDGILVIDELFTPDSSRFWPRDQWSVGGSPPSYDKQIVRNALEKTGWDKTPPAPRLDPEVLAHARSAYHEIFERLTGHPFRAETARA